jgi:hypothetical protein
VSEAQDHRAAAKPASQDQDETLRIGMKVRADQPWALINPMRKAIKDYLKLIRSLIKDFGDPTFYSTSQGGNLLSVQGYRRNDSDAGALFPPHFIPKQKGRQQSGTVYVR